jgi:DNA-binding MarR family transcriptional regulator
MNDFPSIGRNLELVRLLSLVRDALLKARQKELEQYNIHVRRAALLLTVQALGDKATSVELARRLLRERHTVSELLSKMEKDGLLRKVKDLDRKNLVRVVLTDKGREVYNHSSKVASIRNIMTVLSEEERQKLRSLLQVLLHAALQEIKRRI